MSITDIPHDLHAAIEHALRILNWQENLSEDEMPEKWMWHLDWELEAHFRNVTEKRKAQFQSPSSGDTELNPDEIDENAYAARFKS